LAFHTLPLALGVSKKFDLVMNSLTVPRKAKQAIGGIAKLVNGDGEERYVSVCNLRFAVSCLCSTAVKKPKTKM